MASRVKELLDELATTLAEMGMLEEQEPETAMEGDEPVTEGERSAVAASEARQARTTNCWPRPSGSSRRSPRKSLGRPRRPS
jgi:hypothetical protein